MVLLVFGLATLLLAIASLFGIPWLRRQLRSINETILQGCKVSREHPPSPDEDVGSPVRLMSRTG